MFARHCFEDALDRTRLQLARLRARIALALRLDGRCDDAVSIAHHGLHMGAWNRANVVCRSTCVSVKKNQHAHACRLFRTHIPCAMACLRRLAPSCTDFGFFFYLAWEKIGEPQMQVSMARLMCVIAYCQFPLQEVSVSPPNRIVGVLEQSFLCTIELSLACSCFFQTSKINNFYLASAAYALALDMGSCSLPSASLRRVSIWLSCSLSGMRLLMRVIHRSRGSSHHWACE